MDHHHPTASMDRHRLVQQYVERQKAYLPTYTTADLLDECQATPVKPPRNDEFGFDTPVLRPRVPAKKTYPSQGSSKPPMREESRPLANHSLPLQVPSRPNPHSSKQNSKRKMPPTPIGTDSEHAARLADRRERRRKKRAIVDPPQRCSDDIPPATSSKTGNQKAKKPAALALLYGFSATNVTKNRLTLRPPPSFGVFGKGKASAKKKLATTRKSSSRNDVFSEFAFLNKRNAEIAGCTKIDNDSEDDSISSVSDRFISQGNRIVNYTKEDRGETVKTVSRTSPASITKRAESEVWDIELQSKLPSSAPDVWSEQGDKGSAPVVVNLRGAEWSACVNVSEGREQCGDKDRPRRHPVIRSSPLARSDLQGEPPSIHPSHSASQVEHCAADAQPCGLRPATSKYFAEPAPMAIREPTTNPAPPQTPQPSVMYQEIQDAVVDAQMIYVDETVSLTSIPRPMIFETGYDVAPLEFPSDVSSYNDWWPCMDVRPEPRETSDRGYFDSCIGIQDEPTECQYVCQGTNWEWYRPWSPSAGGDVEHLQGIHDDPWAPEYVAECVDCYLGACNEGCASEAWYPGQEFCAEFEDDTDHCLEEEAPGFLEGRALLLDLPEEDEWPRNAMSSGLDQAEMDVASRLRGNHWRPLRF